MDEFFRINVRSSFVIYGASVVGAQVYKNLQKYNCNVVFFMDKRAEEIKSIYSVPVYSMENPKIKEYDKKNMIVIVAVKSPFDHEEIVHGLRGKGFLNILYRPKSVLEGTKDEQLNKISQVYDEILAGEDFIGQSILQTRQQNLIEWKDSFFIKKIEKQLNLVYVPIELLYTDQVKENTYNAWRDLNFMTALPYLHLYDFFAGKEDADIEVYFSFCRNAASRNKQMKLTQSWQNNILRNRYIIYMKMNQSLAIDRDFFERNAPEAHWNDRGYFNLVGCKHRTSLFIHRNLDFIPIKLSNDDYKKWIHQSDLEKVQKFLKKRDIFALESPVEHPYFQCFDSPQVQYKRIMLKSILRFLGDVLYRNQRKVSFEHLHILDLSDDDGYILRNFIRMQCRVTKKISENGKKELCSLLNSLLHIESGKIVDSFNNDSFDYNIVLLDKVDMLRDEQIGDLYTSLEIKYIFVLQVFDEDKIQLDKLQGRKYKNLGCSILGEKRIRWGVLYYENE